MIVLNRRQLMASNLALSGLVLSWALTQTAAAEQSGLQDRKVTLLLDQSVLQGWPVTQRRRVTVTEDHSSDAQAIAAATPEGRAIPIIVLVVGVLSIPVIWQTISELWTREQYGGVIIDLRGGDPKITTSKAVPARMVFVVAGNGTVSKYESQDFSEEMLGKILPTLK
jgi:hypothetical protein